MTSKWALTLLFLAPVTPQVSLAGEDGNVMCIDASVPKKAITALEGRWTELTPEELQFLRGIYAMNPRMPAGLPYGDKAALAQLDGLDGGMVYFIDGDKACTPMQVPNELLTMMRDITTKVVTHEGQGT